MRTRLVRIVLVLVVIGCSVSVVLWAYRALVSERRHEQPGETITEKVIAETHLRAMAEIVSALAELGSLEWQNDPNVLKTRMPELYKTLSVKRASIFEECLWLYRAQCLVNLGKNEEARKITQIQLAKGTDKPDFLLLQIKLGVEKAEDRTAVWNEHGTTVPLSSYGIARDNRLAGGLAADIDPPPPAVPLLGRIQPTLAEIAQLYEKQDFIEDALNVYLEALYGGPRSGDEEQRGGLWLKVAEIERTRGNRELAVRAYLRAVRTWYKFAETTKEGIKQTLIETEPPKTIDSKPRLTRDTAIEIASLYRKVNLHPLALAVLEQSERDTGADLTAEIQTVRTEWEQILGRITQVRGRDCYVLGHKVSEVEDWSSIRILRPTDTFWK